MHSTIKFIDIIASSRLHKVPVTKQNLQISADIFGPDIGALEGNTVHKKSIHVDTSPDQIP